MKKTLTTIAALFTLTACSPSILLQQLDDFPNPDGPTTVFIPAEIPNKPMRGPVVLSPAQLTWIATHPGIGAPNGPTVDPIPAGAPNG